MAGLFLTIAVMSSRKFSILHDTTEQYIECERAAKQLQDASDYLTEQVRLYAMSGKQVYVDRYFTEAEVTKRRDIALQTLGKYLRRHRCSSAIRRSTMRSRIS